MEAPYTDPVGLPVVPDDFVRTPRRYAVGTRLFAVATLGLFLGVATVTTAMSLGAYCITSDAADASQLPTRGGAAGVGSERGWHAASEDQASLREGGGK